jgi:hypothetical protein
MSFPWYSKREWSENTTLIEKQQIAEKIESLGFNKRTKNGVGKFLVALAGDTHLVAFDTGYHNEQYGGFPIF